jgi:tetratricopeptide (TPR) repeat protein
MSLTIEQQLLYAQALLSSGDYLKTIEVLKELVTRDPSNINILCLLSDTARKNENPSEALEYALKALTLEEDNCEICKLIGSIYFDIGDIAQAQNYYLKILKNNPNDAGAISNYALTLKEQKNFLKARQAYLKSLEISPDYAEAHNNYAIMELILGNYQIGFKEYEWRKRQSIPLGNRTYPKPLWLGNEDLAGKTILVHLEQGLGDCIQFSRYLLLLIERGAKVLFAPHKQLKQILSTIDEEILIVDPDDPGLIFDYHCPLLSLPYAFKTEVNSIPSPTPYIFTQNDRDIKWRSRLGAEGFKIGIAWRGSKSTYAKMRAIPLSGFSRLADLKNVRLISLHNNKETLNEINEIFPGKIEYLGEDFDASDQAFLDTASVIKSCDLIISCDTAVAHLAGALGAPTWLMLKYVPHWVWMLNRQDSPWYPNHSLFRQKEPDNWQDIFDEIYARISQITQINPI